VSPFAIVLLVAALALLAFAEWPRLQAKHLRVRPRRRKRRSSHLRVVEPEHDPEEFAREVERDLARLPTIDDRDY
jgi:hypothetical protein